MRAKLKINKAQTFEIATNQGGDDAMVALQLKWTDGTKWLPVLMTKKQARQLAKWILKNTKED